MHNNGRDHVVYSLVQRNGKLRHPRRHEERVLVGAPRIVHMGIRKKGVVGTLGLRIRTRGDTMSGVENGTITVVEVIIGDGSGRKWAGIGRLEWAGIRRLEWLIIGKGRLE
ncbi:hypothetical protein Tco_0194277 [Tanacetum coccineum]